MDMDDGVPVLPMPARQRIIAPAPSATTTPRAWEGETAAVQKSDMPPTAAVHADPTHSLASLSFLGNAGVSVTKHGIEADTEAAIRIQAGMRAKLTRRKIAELQAELKVHERNMERRFKGVGTEIMDLFIEPDVGLLLEHTAGASAEHAGRFAVSGPPTKVAILRRALGDEPSDLSGVISPLSEITLPTAVKRDAGIPAEATHFAFVYPLKKFKRNEIARQAINLAENAWAFALLIGAFAYFGECGRLLCVNALTIVPSPAVLHLVGPYKPRQHAELEMMRLGRLAHVTIDGLLAAGFQRFGWVHPGEAPGGLALSHAAACPHGGFLYEMSGGKSALFVLTGGIPPDRDHFDHDGVFAHAHVPLRKMFVEAVDAHNASKAQQAARWRVARELCYLGIALGSYYGVACAVLCPSMGWTAIEAIYFATATLSTVGYGDLTVRPRAAERLFALALIFVGILVIAVRLTAVVTLLTDRYEHWARRKLAFLFPVADVDAHGRAILPPSLVYYPKNLLPSLLLNTVLQLASAALFMQIEGWGFGSALYHCLVTATTVGYGDQRISTPGGRALAVVHILLSVSMLGYSFSAFDELRLSRAKELKRVTAVNQRLTRSLLERVERHSAALRPEVQRDAAGVTELEFVVCMAIELGMVEMKQLQPFIDQVKIPPGSF